MRRFGALRWFVAALAVGVFSVGGVALAAGGKRRHRGLSLARVTQPTERRGRTVSGDLFVDDSQASRGSENEVAAIPYRYRVG